MNRLPGDSVKPAMAGTANGAPSLPEGASLGQTTSICPRCKRLLDAELLERDGRVVLARACPDHGRFEAVVYGDAERYLEIQRFDKPGEEPLLRAMLRAARERGIPLVMLNTNGIRLARDPGFAPALAEIGVHVYLQFDGFSESTQVAIRGKSLTGEKLRALERCAQAGVSVSLAAAVERDLNEHEVGQIVSFGVEHPAVTGVFFQPVSPSCRSATFALYDGEDLMPLPRLVDVEDYLDYVTNRAIPDLDVREALEGLWSAKAAGGSGPVAERLECIACATAMPAELREVAARGFMIVVQDFQDPYTLDVEKLRKCCVSEIVPDGRLIPFCAYNSVGYREQVRLKMADRRPEGRFP